MAECFIIMPITTPEESIPRFKGDEAHFEHVLDHLFKPAILAAGLEPLSPVAYGADLIHAEIVKQLESSDLVLCDISCINPNVFFELGIRTAVDKPVALVRDSFTADIPFDTSIVNFHTYDASLAPWVLGAEVDKLSTHIAASIERSGGRNPLWRYFGLTTRGAFRPEESPLEAKMDLVLHQLREVTERAQRSSDFETLRRLSEVVERRDPRHLLLEPLTERELTVLRLLPTHYTQAEIAAQLYISANTVRAHIQSIYRKLDAASRQEAVARAQQIGLLP